MRKVIPYVWSEPIVKAWVTAKANRIAGMSDGNLRREYRDYRATLDAIRSEGRTLDQLEEWELYSVVTAGLLEQEERTRRTVELQKERNVKK